MKSVKLNEDIRTRILDNVMDQWDQRFWEKHGYLSQAHAIECSDDARNHIGRTLWLKAYGQEMAEKLQTIPKDLLSAPPFTVQVRGDEYISFNLVSEGMPGRRAGADIVIEFEEWQELLQSSGLGKLRKLQETFEKRRNEFRTIVSRVLDSASTTNRSSFRTTF